MEQFVRIFQVDAFTSQRFSGNPATVMLDADGTDDATLHALAREYSHAETAFVFAPNAADHDVRLRFFNARKEAPFVGHATIAAHAVLVALGLRGFGSCRQHSGTGVIEVAAHTGEYDGVTIEFRQSVPQLDVALPLTTTLRVAEALRLPVAHLHEHLPARVARKGSTRLLLPVKDRRHLDALAPNFDTLVSLGKEIGTDGFFVFAYYDSDGGLSTESRMFCPALGIPEDPVSGNAHAMLGAYLVEAGKLEPSDAFVGKQGRHVNRPGEVRVRLEADQGRLVAAHIGGTATIVSTGTLNL
jgi:PhzF family phenazine biosynthesis protein